AHCRQGVCCSGKNGAAGGRVVMPASDVGRDPDGERLVAGPGERFAFVKKGVLVAIGAPHRTERLAPRRGCQAGRQKPRRAGQCERLPDEISPIVHGATSLFVLVECANAIKFTTGSDSRTRLLRLVV